MCATFIYRVQKAHVFVGYFFFLSFFLSSPQIMSHAFIIILQDGTSNADRDAVIGGVTALGAQITNVYDIFPGFAATIDADKLAAFQAFLTAHPLFKEMEADSIVSHC